MRGQRAHGEGYWKLFGVQQLCTKVGEQKARRSIVGIAANPFARCRGEEISPSGCAADSQEKTLFDLYLLGIAEK